MTVLFKLVLFCLFSLFTYLFFFSYRKNVIVTFRYQYIYQKKIYFFQNLYYAKLTYYLTTGNSIASEQLAKFCCCTVQPYPFVSSAASDPSQFTLVFKTDVDVQLSGFMAELYVCKYTWILYNCISTAYGCARRITFRSCRYTYTLLKWVRLRHFVEMGTSAICSLKNAQSRRKLHHKLDSFHQLGKLTDRL